MHIEKEYRVLGIDPALGTTGYGVLQVSSGRVKLLEAGTIRAPREKPIEARLKEIFDGLSEVLKEHKPDYLAMEQLYSHYERPRTAILMGHARGVICLAAALAQVSVHSYEPTKVKRLLTGNGRAPKSQMQSAVQFQLSLKNPIDPPDVADALAIALCHVQALRLPPQLSKTALKSQPGNKIRQQIEALQSKTRKPG